MADGGKTYLGSAADVRGELQKLVDANAARRRNIKLVAGMIAVVAVGCSGIVSCAIQDPTGCLIVSSLVLFFGLFGAVFTAIALSGSAAVSEKLDSTRDLLSRFEDDLHPGRRVRLVLDTRGNTDDKLTWSGRSRHGNHKTKHRDLWMTLRLILADRTKVKIEATDQIKTRKGSTTRHKRRLKLTVTPAARYALPAEALGGLRQKLRGAASSAFVNPLELFEVDLQEGGRFQIKLMQLDGGFQADEIAILVAQITGFLDDHKGSA